MDYSEFDEDAYLQGSEECAEGGRKTKSSKPPRPYQDLTWEQYNRQMLKEQMTAMLALAPFQWIEFIRTHSEELQRLDESYKESYRRMAQDSMEECKYMKPLTFEDVALLNRTFGPWKKAVPPANLMLHSSEESDPFFGYCREREPFAVLDYMENTTYNWFYNWMHKDQMRGFVRTMTADHIARFHDVIDTQIDRDIGPVTPRFRHVRDGDAEHLHGLLDAYAEGTA